jgi:hypothetical protein
MIPDFAKLATSKPWREVLPIHPAAELFPRMTEQELRERRICFNVTPASATARCLPPSSGRWHAIEAWSVPPRSRAVH